MLDHSLESLLKQVAALPDQGPPAVVEFLVPDALTFKGSPFPHDAAMAIFLDALLGKGFMPEGFTPEQGGRRYRYNR